MSSSPAIAFFDLDRTVLRENSGTLWVRAELRQGRITARQALQAWAWILRYQLGFAALEEVLRQSIATLEGGLERELDERVEAFYQRLIRGKYRTGAAAVLQRHRENGDALVLLTSSTGYLADRVAGELGFDHVLANRFEVTAEGRFTGRLIEPLCFGPGKLSHARRLAEERHIALEDCAFYTDSASDLPVLEAVGRPVAVNPDPRLRRAARARGWAVEDWGPAP
jgi:HAD superfamily hydrolase (TIGR01490 family)